MIVLSIILILATLIIHYKTVFLFGLFSANHPGFNDIISLYFPSRFFFGNSLRLGEFPLWNPDIFLGFPIHAEGQGGFFYPLNILFAIFPQWIAFNYVYILHIFLSGIFMFLFVKELHLKKSSSMIASVVFTFSGFFACHSVHMNLLNACIWIPLGFLFVLRKKYLFISLIFALQLLSGFPQITYYTGIILFFWLIFNTRNIKDISKFFLSSCFAVTVAFCQILPTLELIPHSIRSKGISELEMFSWGYYLKDLLLFVHPYIFGNPALGTYTRKDSIFWENCAFVGIMVLILVVFGFIKNKKDKNIKFFSGLTIGIIIFILFFSVIYKFLVYIPGFNYFRLPQRSLIFVEFSLAIISAYGFQQFNKFNLGVFLVIFSELINFNLGYNNTTNVKYFSKPEIVKFLKYDKELFRIFVYDEGANAWISNYVLSTNPDINYSQEDFLNYLPANTNIFYKTQSLNIESALCPIKDYGLESKVITNVKYILSSTDLNNKRFIFISKLIFPIGLPPLRIYNNKNSFPKAYLVKKDIDRYLPLSVILYMDNKVKIEKKIKASGSVILSDFFYPGWRAYIDGVRSKITPTDTMTRSVEVSQTSKKIIFIFMPISFTIGILISVSSIFLFGFLLYENIGN